MILILVRSYKIGDKVKIKRSNGYYLEYSKSITWFFIFLGSCQIVTIRSIENNVIRVEWHDANGNFLGKDVNEEKIKLFEKYSFIKRLIRYFDKISYKVIFFALLVSLGLNGIFNNYSLLLSN